MNIPKLPRSSKNHVHDTQNMHKKESVSYGKGETYKLADGKLIVFADNKL